jgi:metal-sulfur cluster biosynthetic enzyme
MPVTIITENTIAHDDGRLPATASLHERAVHALRQVMDPELPLNIYDLGLVYKLDINPTTQTAHILMTLTAPNCPVAGELPEHARQAVATATGFTTTLTITFDPPWDKKNLSLEAKLSLGIL